VWSRYRRYEANFPAQQCKTPTSPRFPVSNVESGRAERTQRKACEGTKTADGVYAGETGETVAGRDFTFPPRVRIRKRREYLRIQRERRARRTRHFIVISVPVATGQTRLGLTVSSKVGGSVRRNRVKRRVREIFRKYRKELQPAQDLLIIARAGADTLSYWEIEAELRNLLVPRA